MAIAIAIGIASGIAGIYVSFWLNLASGASIVLIQTAVSSWPRPRAAQRAAAETVRGGGRGALRNASARAPMPSTR